MTKGKFVSYLRVSTQMQGRSGLGLAAQRRAVEQYLNGGSWHLLDEFVEIESGKRTDRPKLDAAMARCRVTGAKLVIAKLDRLARDAHFLLGLEKAGVEFVAVDMPHANRLTIGIMALVAEEEARAISARTKAAFAAAKARGAKLGNVSSLSPGVGRSNATKAAAQKARKRAEIIRPILDEIDVAGTLSARRTARALNERGIPAPRGGEWFPAQTLRLRKTLASGTRL